MRTDTPTVTSCIRPQAFSEGWPGNFFADSALRIASQAVEYHLIPLHFGAASGQGLCHAALGEFDKAAACFHRALEIYPRLETARQNLAGARRGRVAGGNGHGLAG